MKLNIQLFAYTKKEWKDLPSKDTPILAADLNNIENGIANSNDLYTKTEIDEKENNLKAENEYLNSVIEQAFTPVEKEGTSINYDNTINARFKDIKLCGDTTQNGTPTPDNPVDINVVTGEQKITISSGESKQEYPLSLGSMELCKISDYQDYIYKENGIWYKYGAIDKIVLDGSESGWVYDSVFKYFRCPNYNFGDKIPSDQKIKQLSNYFIVTNDWGTTFRDNVNTNIMYAILNSGYRICIRNINYSNVEDFKNWLSTHNTTAYYVLATPTTTEITDTTLLEQLEELAGATTYAGETNIVATSDGLTIIPKTTALTK